MTDRCCAPPPQPAAAHVERACPSCGHGGRPVGLATVQAQVAISLRELAKDAYCFCATPRCPVVYFTADRQLIQYQQLRERVFQKESVDTVLACYCFRYSVGMLQRGCSAARAAIIADIVAGTQQGQCACALRNPQGSCCLGNVRRLIQTANSMDERCEEFTMTQNDLIVPVACNPHALNPVAWAAHQATTAQLFAQTIAPPHELTNGYTLQLPAAAFPTVAAFIEGERRCCPFFTFSIELPPGEAPITLRITGNSEAKAILAAARVSAESDASQVQTKV